MARPIKIMGPRGGKAFFNKLSSFTDGIINMSKSIKDFQNIECDVTVNDYLDSIIMMFTWTNGENKHRITREIWIKDIYEMEETQIPHYIDHLKNYLTEQFSYRKSLDDIPNESTGYRGYSVKAYVFDDFVFEQNWE